MGPGFDSPYRYQLYAGTNGRVPHQTFLDAVEILPASVQPLLFIGDAPGRVGLGEDAGHVSGVDVVCSQLASHRSPPEA